METLKSGGKNFILKVFILTYMWIKYVLNTSQEWILYPQLKWIKLTSDLAIRHQFSDFNSGEIVRFHFYVTFLGTKTYQFLQTFTPILFPTVVFTKFFKLSSIICRERSKVYCQYTDIEHIVQNDQGLDNFFRTILESAMSSECKTVTFTQVYMELPLTWWILTS